jgi:LL-H family phage holin
MERELILTILTALVQLFIVLGLGYLIKFLKTKIPVENLQRYYMLITKFVHSAEQIYGDGQGIIKKKAVIDMVRKTIGNKLTPEEIDKLIEAAVFEMNLVLKKNNIIEKNNKKEK